MNNKKLTLSGEQLQALISRLVAEPPGVSGEHLSREDYLGYLDDSISTERTGAVLAHLEECPDCAARLEHLLAQNRRWQSKERARLLEERRQQMLKSALQQLSPRHSLLQRLAAELDKIVLFPALPHAAGYARAATPVMEAEGQSESGDLQWYYGYDTLGNLIIRVSSFNTALQGVRVNMHSGGWHRLVELALVEPGQVGVETTVPQAELAQLDLSTGIRFELAV